MPYRASLGGEFGGGVTRQPRPQIDVSGAIDALTSGASSLIHGAYLRRQAKDTRDRQDAEDAQKQANVDREFTLKQEDQRQRAEAQRRQDMINGVTPGSEGGATVSVAPSPLGAPAGIPSGSTAIRDAMSQGLSNPTAAPTSSETTTLSPDQEKEFQSWVKQRKLRDVDSPDAHYDYRGFWLNGGRAASPNGHFPDTYKQHGHPTFSVESRYSTGPGDGGTWNGEKFVPSSGPASSAIRGAMQPTSSLTTPVKPGSLGSLPNVQYGEEAPTPSTYDPTKAAAYVRGTETARIQQETAQKRVAAQLAGRQAAQLLGEKLQERLARFKSGLGGAGGKGIRGAMTGNRVEEARKEAAIGLVGYSGGSYDDAQTYLNSPEGKTLRDLGVEARHLMYAHESYLKGATSGAIRLQSGALGASPEEAVGAVTKTRKLLGGGSSSNAAPPNAGAGATAPAPGEPTDDEVVGAMKAGAKTPADVRAWVAKNRKGKK